MSSKDRFEAKMNLARFYFDLFKRRAEIEAQTRLAFWTAIIVGAFAVPEPKATTGNAAIHMPYSYELGAAAALTLFVAFSVWLFLLLHANQKDQKQMFKWADFARNDLLLLEQQLKPHSDQDAAEPRGILPWTFFITQLFISALLMYLCLCVLQHRNVLSR